MAKKLCLLVLTIVICLSCIACSPQAMESTLGTDVTGTPTTQSPKPSTIPPTTQPINLSDYFSQIIGDAIFFDYSLENLLNRTDYVFTAKVKGVSFDVTEYTGHTSGKMLVTTFELEVETQYMGELPETVYLRHNGGYPREEYLEEQVLLGESHNLFEAGNRIRYYNIRYPNVGESYLFTLINHKSYEGYLGYDSPFQCVYTIDEDQKIKDPSYPCYATIKAHFVNQPDYIVNSIELGMSPEEVMDILGEPEEYIGAGTMVWFYTVEDVRIVIGFTIDTEGVFRVTSVSFDPRSV